MVRECRPRERELSSSKLARSSTMTTSVPANVSSAASIIPVGPPPAITTACSAIHHSSFPNACQETLHHTPGLAASQPERCAPLGMAYTALEHQCSVAALRADQGVS